MLNVSKNELSLISLNYILLIYILHLTHCVLLDTKNENKIHSRIT